MPLDFPNSPTNGQQFNDWVFDTTSGAWRFAQTQPGGVPAGSIMPWGGSTAPSNWLICDGSAVSRETYGTLFAVIGTSYGAGNGTTTFNLPDLRGRIPVGRNAGTFGTLGATGGAETHTLTEAQMPSHTHIQNSHGHSFFGAQTGQNLPFTNTGNVWTHFLNNYQYSQPAVGGTVATNQNTGGGQAHNNLQPYQVVNYIIKFSASITPDESQLAPRVTSLEAINAGSRLTTVEGRATALETRATNLEKNVTLYNSFTANSYDSGIGNSGLVWWGERTVSFGVTFTTVPNIAVYPLTTGAVMSAHPITVSTTGFTFRAIRFQGALQNGFVYGWSATGRTV